MDEFLEQFLVESRELVAEATDALLALEKTPQDHELLDSAFRNFHTLKGGAGIVEFPAMEQVVHCAENVLSSARSGLQSIEAKGIGDCLVCLDQVTSWLDEIQSSGGLPPAADAAAAAIVSRFGHSGVPSGGAQRQAATVETPSPSPSFGAKERELLEAQLALLSTSREPGLAGRIASAGRVVENVLRRAGRIAQADRTPGLALASISRNDPIDLQQHVEEMLEAGASGVDTDPSDNMFDSPLRKEARAQTLRVDANRIDALVRLTGELTVAKNAIGHDARLALEQGMELAPALKARHAALDRLVGELQRAVLGIRVLPLRTAFQRFPRLVREMSADLGKPAALVIEGEDTEADKAIVEILVEPLLHVLRNSMDHGIEEAAERAAAGKPAMATIRLSAARQGDHVVLEIADDGRGVNVARVREVARERGVVSAEVLVAMKDEEVIDLVFAPGFSTAAKVTGLSGRGVGMDAVRAAVRRLGGQVELSSTAGKGTKVRFVLPFSAMITQVMTVEAGGQVFGIPLEEVVETIRVAKEKIFPVGAARAIVLRDKTIPLVDLAEALGIPRSEEPAGDATIVVANVEGEVGALRVDRVGERMEIMLKPLDGLLTGMPGIAGSTLLGDGSVLLVLDLTELMQ